MQRAAIILACFSVCTICFAQQYPFVHYTPKDGLVNSRVKKAYQDSKGRMYFLTYGGLSVYDGARFRNFTNQNGLPNNVVNDILEIGEDSILVATNTNRLNLLVNGKIEPFKITNGISPLVNQFYRHEDGLIYLSSDHGLYCLNKDKVEILNTSGITNPPSNQPNLGNIAGSGNYLVITTNEMSFNNGVFLYDIKNDRICDVLQNISAFLVGKDGKNRVWISTSNRLLILDSIALKKGKLLLIPPDKGYRQVENYSTINVAFGKNLAWFVYRTAEFRNSELRRVTEDSNMFRVNLPAQITISYVKDIFIDQENNIWLSNDGEGVFKIVRSPLQIIEKPLGLSENGILASVFYHNAVTWYSTMSKKLLKRSATGMEVFAWDNEWLPNIFYAKGNKILFNNANSIYEALLRDQTKKINSKKIITLNDSDLFIGDVIVDPNGAIISCQRSGISAWMNNTLIFHKPLTYIEGIQKVFIDKANRLWLIRRNFGIDIYSIHPADSSNYLRPLSHISPQQLGGSVRSFVMDKKGLIWIGTRDNGLLGYIEKENTLEKVFHFHTGNGLSDNFVTSLACDSLNNIIAGTQSGLDLVLYETDHSYKIENLSRNNNLFAYISQTWADNSHGYGLTYSGVILQVTSSVKEKSAQTPRLLMEEVKINAKTILQKQSVFGHKENNISFLVAAPSFIDERQISYSYLLEGSGNNSWSDTSSINSIINLTNLSPGVYKLKIKAFFPSHSYDPAYLEYRFQVSPPWWQTWWFRLSTGLLIIGFLILVVRFYFRRKLEKHKAALDKQQAIEKERTRIATDMHDDLGAGLSRIKFLSENIKAKKGKDEPILDDIDKISAFSDEMAEKMGEIVWSLNQKNDTIADLVAFTRSYVLEYLSTQNIRCELDTPLELPSTFITGEMRQHIFLSVKECLHNIVKHAGASQVYFSVKLNGAIEILIHDNGKGIDWNNLKPFSNGIQNIHKRMAEIHGNVIFRNEGGTHVAMNIPYEV